MESTDVPFVSLLGKPEDVHAEIGEAFERDGFVVIIDHGIQPNLFTAAYETSAEVFDLPDATKLRYERADRRHGYIPPDAGAIKNDPDPDLKEFWHIRDAIEGLPLEVPRFGKVCHHLSDQLSHVGDQVLDHVGAHLGKPKGFFREWTRDGTHLTRLVHYPDDVSVRHKIRSRAHRDVGLITLFPIATAPGLEIMIGEREWLPLDYPPDSIVVTVGEMLQFHTYGRLCAAIRRDVNVPGRHFSLRHFVQPRHDVALITAGDYFHYRLSRAGVI